MAELTILNYEGRHRSTWFYVKEDGKNPVLDFIMTQYQSRPEEIKRLRATMARVCECEKPRKKMFRHEGNGIYVIKAHQARVYSFQDGQHVIMCHAVFKKQDKARKEDIDKTDLIRDEYKRRKGAQT